MTLNDTICAPATAPGTGAISVIRISGPDTFSAVDRIVRFNSGEAASAKGYSIKYGSIIGPDGVLDDVLVSIFRAPHSYTGEDSAEISCHSSAYIVSQIMEMLLGEGCRTAEPGEFTRRAFIAGKMDLAQAEAVADVIAASSRAAHRVAMNQLKGGYSSELRSLRASLLELSALMELELDFSEEDVEFADRDRLRSLLSDTSAHIARLASSFRAGNAVRNGVPVAIVGAVNAGKSTLLNALLGDERAIVSDIAGTTRDTVEETMVLDGILFRFIDTAGIRSTSDTVEAMGVRRSLDAISKAAVVLEVVDATNPAAILPCTAGPETPSILPFCDEGEGAKACEGKGFRGSIIKEWQTRIVVLNKCDIAAGASPLTVYGAGNDVSWAGNTVPWAGDAVPGENGSALRISAKTGEGLERLRDAICEAGRNHTAQGESVLVTNARHYEALVRAGDALSRVSDGLASLIPTDLVAQDLREALFHLGTILGEVSTDEVLGEIFRKFCIGK